MGAQCPSHWCISKDSDMKKLFLIIFMAVFGVMAVGAFRRRFLMPTRMIRKKTKIRIRRKTLPGRLWSGRKGLSRKTPAKTRRRKARSRTNSPADYFWKLVRAAFSSENISNTPSSFEIASMFLTD